ncbi:low temperature requirement protein A [Deinococcus knuensis]|uniref:Low temperature requirement protein A n=1 Tax=Deinococcus knuensis TaxID=1837380 RepID=A0ABQ2T0C4_9DEIO|nr:low temperature requirement protein A [Deinococcus knuensis]GGS42387.1 hypothetical protein GCM10008961_36980 [Deinococcus knuensis]
MSFLELFYDVVYVALVAQVGHGLSQDPAGGAAGFALLFLIVWWAWFNGTTYHDLHGNNDLRTRVFTFLQMFTVAGMAVFARGALGADAASFALCYAAFQLIMAFLWWRTGVHDPAHRVLARPYALTFLLSASLFVGSVFAAQAWREALWTASVLLSLVSPAAQFSQAGRARAQVGVLLQVSPALAERFGLFTILVLAEVVTGSVQGVMEVRAGGAQGAALLLGPLGIALAVMLWWLYFDFVSRRLPTPERRPVLRWIYSNLLTALSITATGALIRTVIEEAARDPLAPVTPLLPLAAAVFLLGTALLLPALEVPAEVRGLYRRAAMLTAAAAAAMTGLSTLPLPPLVALPVMLAAIMVPVVYGVTIWIRDLGARDIEEDQGPLDR